MNIVKCTLVVVAAAGLALAPSAALANDKNDNVPPGQTCISDNKGGFVIDGDPKSPTFGSKGECASSVAKGNGSDKPSAPAS